jgi:hypothetical protein
MPSGPPELHEKWKDDGNATEYLEKRGYTLTRQWEWIKPKDHEPTDEEKEAIYYLIVEWDYGGLMSDAEG